MTTTDDRGEEMLSLLDRWQLTTSPRYPHFWGGVANLRCSKADNNGDGDSPNLALDGIECFAVVEDLLIIV
jgi:hypothetical protein